ncbi:tetA [Symbiodinium necroappetens]|uniref:TetA protein n=1 Tax=Symbiodinium necroappetens TaxID=1628268 RepID=A0A812J1E4_9DINO|nr:tetA [Symbiodinium necroappetens]
MAPATPLKPALKPQSRNNRAAQIELGALICSSFIWACGQWILAPALPYFAMAKGCHAFHYAMISSAYAATQMLSSPLLGVLSDRLGRRPILLGGLAATSVVYLLMANASTIFQLLLARGALGFVSGTMAAEVAYMADLTWKSDRAYWVNLQARLQAAGCLLGPAIGGMVEPYERKRFESHFEFEHLCYAISGLCVLNLIIGVRFFTCPKTVKAARPSVQTPADSPRRKISVVSSNFLHGPTKLLLLACFIDGFSLAVSDGPEAFFLHDQYGFAPEQQAQFMMTCSASSLLWGSLAPYMGKLLPAKLTCVVFTISTAGVMVLMTLSRVWWTPYLYAVLFGCFATLVEVASKASLVNTLVPEKQQAAVYGMQRGLLNLGFSLGPLVGGGTYETSRGLPYTISACCLCISALIYLSLPSSLTPGGDSLLGDDIEDTESKEALEHLSNQAPLPAKRFGATLATEKARRVYFVCPDLYEAYREQAEQKRRHSFTESALQAAGRSNTIGEESFSLRMDSDRFLATAWATRRRGRSSAIPSPMPETCRAPLLIVGMTSLPSRLEGIGPALESIASQSRRPDRLVLSLPRLSEREGRKYELPDHVTCLMAKHPWMEVNWLEEDAGPGTKLLGAADWFQRSIGRAIPGDMLMLLDDDHAYLPSALGELCQIQQHLGCDYISSFFAYFFRGLIVPQGADIVALQLDSTTLRCIIDFHRCFVKGDAACFLVDDLWTAMFYFLSGRQVRSFRDRVIQRGLETIYSRTDNASVAALMDLDGSARRDRAMVSAFEGLLQRLLDDESQLSSIAGEDAVQRLHKLAAEVRQADRRIVELNRWLLQAQSGGTCESQLLRRATEELAQLMHLYLMQKLPEKPPSTSDADILAEEVNAAVPEENHVSSRAVKVPGI